MLGSSVTPVTRMSTRSGPSDQASNYDETPALNVEDWTIRNKSRRDLIRYGEVSAEKLIFGVQLHLAPGCIKDSKASLVIDRGQGELAFSEQNFVLTFLMDTPRTVGARQDLILRNDKLIQTLLNAEPPDWTFVPGSVFIENR
jgi:D-lyxose ketol-isomerase